MFSNKNSNDSDIQDYQKQYPESKEKVTQTLARIDEELRKRELQSKKQQPTRNPKKQIQPLQQIDPEQELQKRIDAVKIISTTNYQQSATTIADATQFAQKNIPQKDDQDFFVNRIKTAYDMRIKALFGEDIDNLDNIDQSLGMIKRVVDPSDDTETLTLQKTKLNGLTQDLNQFNTIINNLDKASGVFKELTELVNDLHTKSKTIASAIEEKLASVPQEESPITKEEALASLTLFKKDLQKVNQTTDQNTLIYLKGRWLDDHAEAGPNSSKPGKYYAKFSSDPKYTQKRIEILNNLKNEFDIVFGGAEESIELQNAKQNLVQFQTWVNQANTYSQSQLNELRDLWLRKHETNGSDYQQFKNEPSYIQLRDKVIALPFFKNILFPIKK